MAKVIFRFKDNETIIDCCKEDKIKDICRKYVSKLNIDISNLQFIYDGKLLDDELTFEQKANEKNKKIMKYIF